jgi:hypothetical protein
MLTYYNELQDSAHLNNRKSSKNIKLRCKMNWHDVIQVRGGDMETTPPDQTNAYVKRVESFLDYLEKTERGQKLLNDIKEKWGDKKIGN